MKYKNKISELDEYISIEENIEVEEFVTRNNEKSIAIEKDGHLYALTTSINISEDADIWYQNYANMNPYTLFVFFGLANGVYLEKLYKEYPCGEFIVYEPCGKVLKHFLHDSSKKSLIEKDEILLTGGKKGRGLFYTIINDHINGMTVKNVCWIVLPGYKHIWLKELLEVYRQYTYFVNQAVIEIGTKKKFAADWSINYLKCLPDLLSQYSITDLHTAMRKHITDDSVAIIVGAGPSLANNIKYLHKAKGRVLIIGVDTALKPMVRNGILPDILVSVDTLKPKSFFDIEEFKDIPLVMESNGNAELVNMHQSYRFYAVSGENYTDYLTNKINKKIEIMQTGGSVGNSAYSLAVNMGYKKIIMIGQDLALTGGKLHSSGVDEVEVLSKDGVYMDVEAYGGGTVTTRGDYNIYRKWFELKTEINKEVTLINATEGGARIRGTIEMSLQDALNKYIGDDDILDINSILIEIPKFCSGEEYTLIQEYLLKLPNKFRRYKRRLLKGIENYNDLNYMKAHGEIHTEKFNEILSEIIKTNKWLRKISDIALLNMYQLSEEGEIERNIYDIKDDIDDEWNENISLGIKSFQLYIDKIDDFLKDFDILKDGLEKNSIE